MCRSNRVKRILREQSGHLYTGGGCTRPRCHVTPLKLGASLRAPDLNSLRTTPPINQLRNFRCPKRPLPNSISYILELHRACNGVGRHHGTGLMWAARDHRSTIGATTVRQGAAAWSTGQRNAPCRASRCRRWFIDSTVRGDYSCATASREGAMVRIVLSSFVRTLTALTMVVLALSTPAGAQELGQLYGLNETVSVEADVRLFMWGELTARIVIAPLDKTKAGPSGLIAVAWHPATPLSQQGVPMYWLKPNERVVVTGHPRRPLRPGTKPDGSLLLKTITRQSDGWKWPGGPLPSAKPTAQPSSSNASGAVGDILQAECSHADRKRLPRAVGAAAPRRHMGICETVGTRFRMYLPGHLSELRVLTISEAADVLTLHKILKRSQPTVLIGSTQSSGPATTFQREAW